MSGFQKDVDEDPADKYLASRARCQKRQPVRDGLGKKYLGPGKKEKRKWRRALYEISPTMAEEKPRQSPRQNDLNNR